MTKDPIVVMKFGGSVLKDAYGFRRVAAIIKAEKHRKIVIVSAMAGVTDELYELVRLAIQANRDTCMNKYNEILSRHLAIWRKLDIGPRPDRFEEICIHIEKVLEMILYMRETTPVLTDAIVSQGEKFSAIIINALVSEDALITYIPATKLIVTLPKVFSDDSKNDINFTQTKEKLEKYVKLIKPSTGNVMVTEGFVAGNLFEQPITLGRNGSDYSAAIIGSLLQEVEEVQFWKDVPGVMTADPKLTRLATPISSISYDEIIEATRLGAKILHPEAIAPLFGTTEKKVVIKDINAPRADGTEIVKKSKNRTVHGVTMITVTRNLEMHFVEEKVESKAHLAPEIYLTLRKKGIEFVTSLQGFSDKNFTIISHPDNYQQIEEWLQYHCRYGDGKFERLTQQMAQFAVIGSNMRGKPGIAGKFLTALGKAQVNIRIIQQGSSEHSMAVIINDKDVEKAIVAVHDAFDLTKP